MTLKASDSPPRPQHGLLNNVFGFAAVAERMQARGRLSATADPASLATATMALLQGGLLLTQVRRDPKQLRTALAAARVLLRSAAA
jgi:hypothetical protein